MVVAVVPGADRGDGAALARPPRRRRVRRRRRADRLPAPVLVLRPPGRLRHVLPVRRGAWPRSIAVVLAQAASSATARFVVALLLFTALSMSVWAHHMFATGADAERVLLAHVDAAGRPGRASSTSTWSGRCGGGAIRLAAPMLFAIGFIVQFLIGGADRHLRRLAAARLPRHRQLLRRRATSTTRCSPAACSASSPASTTGSRRSTGAFLREGLGRLHFVAAGRSART